MFKNGNAVFISVIKILTANAWQKCNPIKSYQTVHCVKTSFHPESISVRRIHSDKCAFVPSADPLGFRPPVKDSVSVIAQSSSNPRVTTERTLTDWRNIQLGLWYTVYCIYCIYVCGCNSLLVEHPARAQLAHKSCKEIMKNFFWWAMLLKHTKRTSSSLYGKNIYRHPNVRVFFQELGHSFPLVWEDFQQESSQKAFSAFA